MPKPLSPPEMKWLKKITGGKSPTLGERAKTLKKQQKAKEAVLTKINEQLAGLKEEIRAGQTYKLKMRHRLDKKSLTKDSDANKEVDTEHHRKRSKGIDGDDNTQLMIAQFRLESLTKEMKDLVVVNGEVMTLKEAEEKKKKDKTLKIKPLFESDEIADEFWTPLVREGIIPENAVPKTYSEVAQTFEGTTKLYNNKIGTLAKETTRDRVAEKVSWGKDVLDTANVLRGAIELILPDAAKLPFDIGEAVLVTAKATLSIAEGALRKSAKGIVDGIGDSLYDCVYTATSNKALAGMVKNSFRGIAKVPELARAMAKRDFDAAADLAADCIACAFADMDFGGGGSKQYTEIGTAISGALKGGKLAVQIALVVKEGKQLDTAELIKLMGALSGQLLQTVQMEQHLQKEEKIAKEGEELKKLEQEGKLTEAEQGIQDTIKELSANKQEELKELKEKLESIESQLKVKEEELKDKDPQSEEYKQLKDDLLILDAEKTLFTYMEKNGNREMSLLEGDQNVFSREDRRHDQETDESQGRAQEGSKQVGEGLSELAEKLKKEKAKEEELVEDIEDSVAEFDNMLAEFFDLDEGDPDDEKEALRDMYTIERLIEQVEADRKIIEIINAALSSGAGVSQMVQTFFPQAGAVTGSLEFTKSAIAAVRRAQDLNTWLDQLDDAKKAVSIYAEPIKNRVKTLKIQLSSDVLNATLALAKAAGGIAACTGIDMGAGAATVKVAEAGQKLKDLIYKVYDKRRLEKGWDTYVKARSNPEDRIEVRKAFRRNPTLAKYVLAYGAVERGDPIAKEAMAVCGLNLMTLKHPGTNANKVVQFLETKFPEDPKLDQPLIQEPGLYDGPVELTAANWLKVKGMFEKKRFSPLVAESTGAIEGALLKVAQMEKKYQEKAKANPDQPPRKLIKKYQDQLANLRGLVASYKPVKAVKKGTKPHKGMVNYVSNVLTLITNKEKALKTDLDRPDPIKPVPVTKKDTDDKKDTDKKKDTDV